MLEFEIQRSNRRCFITDTELKPGDEFFSALTQVDDEVQRHDYSVDAWQGPPENCLGWWKTQVPSLAQLRMKWAPNDVMLHYFEQLAEDAQRIDVRYILSLLLWRRRLLTQQKVDQKPDGTEIVHYHCNRNNRDYAVISAELATERIESIQQELAELLYCPGAPASN